MGEMPIEVELMMAGILLLVGSYLFSRYNLSFCLLLNVLPCMVAAYFFIVEPLETALRGALAIAIFMYGMNWWLLSA